MYSDIERRYRKNSPERHFWWVYARWALLAVVVTSTPVILWGWNSWVMAAVTGVLLLIIVMVYFHCNLNHTLGQQTKHSLKNKLILYYEHEERRRIEALLVDLKIYHIDSVDKLRLAIDYYERQRPVATKPNLLEWVVSILVALVSVVVLAYDDSTHQIDVVKLSVVFDSAIKIAGILLVPFIVAAILHAIFISRRSKLDTALAEDLSVIYMNFDKYRDRLE